MLSVFKGACFTVDEYILHFDDPVANLWSIQKLAGKIVHICMSTIQERIFGLCRVMIQKVF